MKLYGIKDGYEHRTEAPHFDDTPFKDEFQRSVYEAAAAAGNAIGAKSVVDVGCGSGYKLLQFFGHLYTIGVDVPKTVEWLERTYPNRVWRYGRANDILWAPHPKLVICSDVIEHVPEPNEFLDYLLDCDGDHYVISTPDRELTDGGFSNGPPRNVHHYREWTHDEFVSYLGERFEIVRSIKRATTIVEARRKV